MEFTVSDGGGAIDLLTGAPSHGVIFDETGGVRVTARYGISTTTDRTALKLVNSRPYTYWLDYEDMGATIFRKSITSPILPVNATETMTVEIFTEAAETLGSVGGNLADFFVEYIDNPWACRVYDGGPQTVTDATRTALTFDSSTSGNSGSGFLGAGAPSNGFIIPAGVTHINASVNFSINALSTARKGVCYIIRDDGVTAEDVGILSGSTHNTNTCVGCCHAWNIPVSEGDEIRVEGFHDVTSGTAQISPRDTIFSIEDVTGYYGS